MRHAPRTKALLLALAAGALPLAACGDDDDPVAPVETFPIAAARLEGLADSLELITGRPVFSAFLGTSFMSGLPFGGLLNPFVPQAALLSPEGVAPRADVLAQRTTPIDPTIPDSLRGLTFVRDLEEFPYMEWRRDTLPDGRPRPGAPASGTRFVLTEFHGFNPELEPGERLGHLDLVQQGAGTSAKLTALVYDADGVLVQQYARTLNDGLSGIGWTASGSLRIDESTTSVLGRSIQQAWTSSAPLLDVRRSQSFGSAGPARSTITHALTMDGTTVGIRATINQQGFSTTYTIMVGDAAFATATQGIVGSPTINWRHVRGDRPLTVGERAQVVALLNALYALPNAEMTWSEAHMHLLDLKYGGFGIPQG